MIALVCSRNCIATDISEADGWCACMMVWTVCPCKSMMSTWIRVEIMLWRKSRSRLLAVMLGSTGLRMMICKIMQDGDGVGGAICAWVWVLFADVNL